MTSPRFSLGDPPSPLDRYLNDPGHSQDIVVLFDADALFFQKAPQDQSVPLALQNDKVFNNLRIVYYFDMRAAMAVVSKDGRNPDPRELLATRKRMFSAIMGQATCLALQQTLTRKPFQPPWLDVFIDDYKKYMSEQLQSLLASVNLKVVHDGYMTARADQEGNILISSKLKPFLATWNTFLLTSNGLGCDDELFRPALAYCLQPAIDFDLMRLPVVVAPNTRDFRLARQLAIAQTEFLLLHELGHVHYRHNSKTSPVAQSKEPLLQQLFSRVDYETYQEYEADAFALREVLSSLMADVEGKTDLFAVSVEFLFSFIICVEATSHKVRSASVAESRCTEAVFAKRLEVLRSLEPEYGWKSIDGEREAEIERYTGLAQKFTQAYLKRLDAFGSQELADEIQHRKGVTS
jgi:hypothetical protein